MLQLIDMGNRRAAVRKRGNATFIITACIIIAWSIAISAAPAQAQGSIERGRYLVEGILTCGNCHSPRGPGGVIDTGRLYSGGPQTWNEPAFTVKGSNITPDAETGIGTWSAAETKRAIGEGVRPNGGRLAPIMPYLFYKVFMPGDLDAVVAYVRSVPPVHNEVQRPIYKTALPSDVLPGADKPPSETDLRDPVKRGFYLATIGHCMECHTPVVNDHHDFAASLGKGGQTFRGPWGESVSRNITSHKEKGIGAWSDAEIKRAITQALRRDGSRLKPPMGFDWYARMSDEDLTAVVAYLRTLPPKE
jgi:mono/diheme cytochrome c family protein